MSDKRSSAVFNIGNQQGNINNVAGDMTNYGNQNYVSTPVSMVRQELVKLRAALSTVHLDPDIQEGIGELLSDTDQELNKPHANAQKVARPIERLTKLLKDAGAISAAGAALIEPLQRISSWLGASGQAIARLIA